MRLLFWFFLARQVERNAKNLLTEAEKLKSQAIKKNVKKDQRIKMFKQGKYLSEGGAREWSTVAIVIVTFIS